MSSTEGAGVPIALLREKNYNETLRQAQTTEEIPRKYFSLSKLSTCHFQCVNPEHRLNIYGEIPCDDCK